MANLLVIRLHPSKPVSGNDFTSFLTGLSIKAFQASIDEPQAKGTAFGEAKYDATIPASPSVAPQPVHAAGAQIGQHFVTSAVPIPPPPPQFFSRTFHAVATAVIEIPDPTAPSGEFRTADVRLEITRAGSTISHNQVYYNVPVRPGPLAGANPNTYQTFGDISLHLALPSPGLGGMVVLPEDGSAPNYTALRAEIENVLNAEQSNTNGIESLTPRQCRHIAREIIWNRSVHPLPAPGQSLETLYTEPNSNAEENDRKAFEGELVGYYSKLNSEAERLTSYVFSLSAAIWCEEQSTAAEEVGFHFPIPSSPRDKEAKVILFESGGGALNPSFEVGAEYFYALTSIFPPQIDRVDRYKLSTKDADGQAIAAIVQAYDSGVLDSTAIPGGNARNHAYQIARRLRALGTAREVGIAKCELSVDLETLVTAWLAYNATEEIEPFWATANASGHRDLALCAVTQHLVGGADASLLMAEIRAIPVNNVSDLKNLTRQQWQDLFDPAAGGDPSLLPEFTKPGTTDERTQAFIRYLRRFFEVSGSSGSGSTGPLGPPPGISRSPGNLLDAFLVAYNAAAGADFDFDTWDPSAADPDLDTALGAIFPGDSEAQGRFRMWLECIHKVFVLTDAIGTDSHDPLRFSVMEALWARGFTTTERIDGFTKEDFKAALAGSVAYKHSDKIWDNSGVKPPSDPDAESFLPVNPDGSLVNCIPLPHRSPLGPVAYLHELLQVTAKSSCENPLDPNADKKETVAELLSGRRGDLETLLVTRNNLDVPLPLVDIVNESLEHMVANDSSNGVVYDTAEDEVAGHELSTISATTNGAFPHDPETLLESLPEHSSPATPTAQFDATATKEIAYEKLESDFSSCLLPYSQPLDVSRTYLTALGTNRFSSMRRFRKDVTEFVLDPANETAEFQTHLWRYPVRIDTAIEYIGLTPEEYEGLFQNDISNAINPPGGRLALYQLFGFKEKQVSGDDWTDIVVKLPEFLERTCLSYCELVELWQSKFIEFGLEGEPDGLPACEPCCLKKYTLEFTDLVNDLEKLAVFIRLLRKLKAIPSADYSFAQLRDICEVLNLFNGNSINKEFIRQLAAFQIFRDDFGLSLTDRSTPAGGATGAERTHLLAFWSAGAAKKDWAQNHLLEQIQRYAESTHGCDCREPEFLKLLQKNFDAISQLAGFDPTDLNHTWDAHPSHTLRFAEILAKIYASEFSVGELLFLFTNEEHLRGDDPFPLQTPNEAKDSPLGLPDDEDTFSLWSLRTRLLDVEVADEDIARWSWQKIGRTLKDEFGFSPPAGPATDHWLSIGKHLFPSVLNESGINVDRVEQQYRVALDPTSEAMWNTPAAGPFQYDDGTKELWTQIPLTDEAVLEKLDRVRQLTDIERKAVQDLYFSPRLDLAHFAFLFENFTDAQACLIQELDETKRWNWFQWQFALFYKRCTLIAEHVAGHVQTGDSVEEVEVCPQVVAQAKLLLKHLWSDENMGLTAWEDDNGKAPDVTWTPRPNGGAFAVLLGLVGTGMIAEYFGADEKLRWREVRGGLTAFGAEENAANAPVPTILPAMDYSVSAQLMRLITVENGFANSDADDQFLGGTEPFTVKWHGLLLIDCEGKYRFGAGAPTVEGELPNFEAIEHSHSWRVTLSQGQRTWVLLAHDWANEESPASCAEPIELKRGFYGLEIEFKRKPFDFDGPEDLCPQSTGFQLKYELPGSENDWQTVPNCKLFRDFKNASFDENAELEHPPTLLIDVDVDSDIAEDFLSAHYTSTIRDMRRSYQRVFKALLMSHRLGLSADPTSDSGQSELGYLLSKPEEFQGQSYPVDGAGFKTHRADFDPNFFPILDNFAPPAEAQDKRAAPSTERQQAMFDWWERLFDYTVMRSETQRAPERPVWLLFHEAAENHTHKPAQLLRHMGVNREHTERIDPATGNLEEKGPVTEYFDPTQGDLSYDITSTDLVDDRWPVRIWQAEKWVRGIERSFAPNDISQAKPFLWASDGPEISGNTNLTKSFRDACIESGDPRRYKEIKKLNDQLRLRGRDALVAYLIRFDRVALDWGGHATEPKQLSEQLLSDVRAEICQKASRIEEAITAIQLFVQRARLGLESSLIPTRDFTLVWDRHFSSFRVWEACKRRHVYRENWIEWNELRTAQQSEAFQFLETQLRESNLTVPVPGGLPHWTNKLDPPNHSPLTLLQHREPSAIGELKPDRDGIDLMGQPDRHSRPNWLAPLEPQKIGEVEDGEDSLAKRKISPTETEFPLWFKSAVRLGAKFIRVAAAGTPPANTTYDPKCEIIDRSPCCEVCDQTHPAIMDEYYFWIEESESFEKQEQEADWGATSDDPTADWRRPEKLPGLLHWDSERTVHLHWCRVHNGEFQQPRKSDEALAISDDADLELVGRAGDSLTFSVTTAKARVGYVGPPDPGFRYDIQTDAAVVVPNQPVQIDPGGAALRSAPPPPVAGLAAFPFFAWFDLGAPILPPSFYSPAIVIAGHLRAHCRFEEALKWYELVYHPLQRDNRWVAMPSDADPKDHCCASDPVDDEQAKNRAILMHHLDTLNEWGAALMRENTPESFRQASLIFDTACKILGDTPVTVLSQEDDDPLKTIEEFVPDCAPLNPRLLCVYTGMNDQLGLIHDCLSAWRQKNGRPKTDMPYFGNSEIRDCWKLPDDCCSDDFEWCISESPYRFQVLLQKANELLGDVRGLGGALLSAFEKGDAEYLASMRATHERQLLNLALDVRKNQWRESDWQVQALQKTKEMAQTRLRYYQHLIDVGLISGEAQYEPLTISSTTLRAAGNISEAIGQTMNLIPDPNVGFPVSFVTLPPGKKLAMIFSAARTIATTVADILNTVGSLGLTKSGWERREDEWEHQVELITVELEQIERQIRASERRRDIALRELNNHQQQMENSAEVHDFLRDKFTNHALYLWLQQETAALYYQSYELAMHCARLAQRAFNFERGHTSRKFISCDNWDNLHEGLLAGERLQLSLRQMEKAYYDENEREYELSKSISLRHHFPEAFFQLVHCGECELEIPEWLFDLDYPGHYMRRIKNVTLTLPCVVGPHTGVHCRLTLLSSKTRVRPSVVDPPRDCCDVKHDGYSALPDDPRFVAQYAATDAIATSSGQNDSGMFELRFNDERYLPFEFHGSVSRWRIELPHENNHFDTTSLSDAILQMNFTARQGGMTLANAAQKNSLRKTPNAGVLLLDVKRDFPDAWHRFTNGSDSQLELNLSTSLFPYAFRTREIDVSGLELLVESDANSLDWNVSFGTDNACESKRKQSDCSELVLKCVPAIEQCNFLYGQLTDQLWRVRSVDKNGQRLVLKLRSNNSRKCDNNRAECCHQIFALIRYSLEQDLVEGPERGCC